MVARPTAPFRSANAGELSASARGRIDIKQYYSAGLAFKNIEPVPQGGFRQMGGSWHFGPWRRPLETRAISGASTIAGPHTGTQTVWSGTVSGTVAAVLVSGFDISAGTATFTVEAQVDAAWETVGGPFAVTDPATAVTRLAAFAPGGEQTATALRIRATFSTSSTVAIGGVSAFYEDGTPARPRYVPLRADDGTAYMCMVTAGIADFYTASGYQGAARIASVTSSMLADLGSYAEGRTIGLFHGTLETVRLFQATPGQHHDWQVDLWPYDEKPLVDLGGSYSATSDRWEVFFTWPDSATDHLYLAMTIDGEPCDVVRLEDGAGNPNSVDTGSPDWSGFASAMQSAIDAVLGSGVSIGQEAINDSDTGRKFIFTFGGALTGREYQFAAAITNTANIAANVVHTVVGGLALEPLWSASRGWPGYAALYQDRMILNRTPAVPGSVAMSEVGEYFTFDTEALADNAARLDKIRSLTTETVLAVKESQYLLLWTDEAAYFINNRTIDRNAPVNFVKASEVGIQPNCAPFDLEGVDYYVAISPNGLADYSAGGKQLLTIGQDGLSTETKYVADPVSLLASHLVDLITRSARQRPQTDLDAAKAWLMRSDGRLVAGQFIKSQEILGFCEWIAAASGLVREIAIDGRNRLWLAIERSGVYSHELYDTSVFLHDAVTVTPDMAGEVTGLPYEDDAEVYARADGWDIGPFSVSDGTIDLGDAYTSAIVGRWQPPRFETMPMVYVTRDDDVIWRPGRIHTVHLNIMDTTSLAIGANGEDPETVDLTRFGDTDGAPPPARTELVTVAGLPGSMEGTTAVITQLMPGDFRVRDFSIGAKL